MKLLFVCSRNQWRSPTAEKIFSNRYRTRSAGTSASARIRISEKHILWSDVIFVMEKRHKQILEERFVNALENKAIIVLDISDDYQFMDKELIGILERSVNFYLTE